MTFWQPLDPRRHLGAAIGWAVFLVVVLFALGAGAFAAAKAESEVRGDSEYLLAQFAIGIVHALDIDLETRHQVVRAAAAQLATSGQLGDAPLRRQLATVQREFPEFGWLGVAATTRPCPSATHGLAPGEDVSARRWFRQALRAPADGAAAGPPPLHEPSTRSIELAAPIRTAGHDDAGVLAAALPWSWIDRRVNELLARLDRQRRFGLDVLLAAGDRMVLSGPPSWRGRVLTTVVDLSEGGAFLVGRAAAGDAAQDGGGPAWTVVVRQRAGTAVARARAVGRTVFLSVLGAGLLAAAIAVWSVQLLIRRLARLAGQAQAVQHGAAQQLAVPAGRDEVSHIGAVLVQVMEQLRREKQALERLNTELDQRVAERTVRVERLADDARHAAVTRERLRLARDLHDTLAHSMMALLTQLRLVRKLRTRWSEQELEQELERAESVAASGLAEARAAISHMRHNGVREAGLSPALQELLRRFRERTGLAVTLQLDASAGALADERAETAFRVIEEALHNVECHAQASLVRLRLDTLPPSAGGAGPHHARRVRLELADDGVGFDPAERPPGHFGLRGMQEQAALMDARLELLSQPGRGTRVVLEFEALG